MLQRPSTTIARPTNASGKNLRRVLRGKPAHVRAVAAAKLVTGEWQDASVCACEGRDAEVIDAYLQRERRSDLIDLVGKRFGCWVVTDYARGSKWGSWWACTCDCGARTVVLGHNLRGGFSKSCGCSRRVNLVGQRFGRWLVIRRVRIGWWLCRCDCGARVAVRGNNLQRGKTKSCGCLSRERATTHGLSNSPEYQSWKAMRARCTNPRAADFEHYGGRGISVCKEWRFSFEAFYADLGQRPERHSLDRVDVNGNYEPKNCRWADDKQQRKNRRPPQPVKRRRFIEQAELSSPPLDDPPF